MLDHYSRSQPLRIPALLAWPMGWLPVGVHSRGLAVLTKPLFRSACQGGALDFLRDRVLEIHLSDARVRFRITLGHDGLRASDKADADVVIEGDCAEFLLLVSQQEDPDSLFFSRRLRLSGDTELGLQVKNFLDAQELPEALHAPLRKLGVWVQRRQAARG